MLVPEMSNKDQISVYFDRLACQVHDEARIVLLDERTAAPMIALIRNNLREFEGGGSVLSASFRRSDRLLEIYQRPATRYFVATLGAESQVVGGVGLGSLAALPVSEGIGEIRDLVVDSNFRGRGLAKRLLRECVEEARRIGFKRLYLETTPQMLGAQKLFCKYGFRPVKEMPQANALAKISDANRAVSDSSTEFPVYFLLENL